MLALGLSAQGQLLNDWTNPVSAHWESSSWSLGVLPASNQTVTITNAGYKAVDIDSATVSGYPDSLTVSNLTVSAPTNGLGTLLLNYAGTAAPLRVLNGCTIGTNGTLDNLESSFEVGGTNGGDLLLDGGTFVQEGGLTLVTAPTFVRNGSFNITNANLTLGELILGSAGGTSGNFNQNGGSIAAQRIDIEQGFYHMTSGVLYSINGTTCTGGPFVQFGGTNYGNISLQGDYYELLSGMAQGNVLGVANENEFEQNGGLLDMQFINVTATTNYPIDVVPRFYGGVIHCGTLNIGSNGRVELRGAEFFVTNNFDLHGLDIVVGHGHIIEHADFSLMGGNLHLPSMSLGAYGTFSETGGSNEIGGGLSMYGGLYWMAGGTLETTYTGVGLSATFAHLGGNHFIHGVLSITGAYNQSGGNLLCEGLYLRGTLTMTRTYMGMPPPPAGTFTNTGLLNLGGTLSTELPDVEAGQVELATNATIAFSNGFPAALRFASSSAVGWTAGALLVIVNWSSSEHLFVGNDASGLSPSQLQQVEFVNPAGFAPGIYPAQILSTGEIVPGQRPTLGAVRLPNALVLTWSGNYQLLSATNLAGPYLPVPSASSPWTNFFNAPYQFFELQSSP
jgi:hypothetical protein